MDLALLWTIALLIGLWYWQKRSVPPVSWRTTVEDAKRTLELDRYMRRHELSGEELELFRKERREALEASRRMRWVQSPGTLIRLADGREATVVKNLHPGPGIKWGRHELTYDDLTDIEHGNPRAFSELAPD